LTSYLIFLTRYNFYVGGWNLFISGEGYIAYKYNILYYFFFTQFIFNAGRITFVNEPRSGYQCSSGFVIIVINNRCTHFRSSPIRPPLRPDVPTRLGESTLKYVPTHITLVYLYIYVHVIYVFTRRGPTTKGFITRKTTI